MYNNIFQLSSNKYKRLWVGLFFISPWIFGFVAFLLYPIVWTFIISFTRYSGFGEAVFIGIENYYFLTEDEVFWESLYNTFYYTVLAVPIGIIVGMILALAMNVNLPEVAFYRATLYLPSILPLFAVAFIFIILLDPTRGLLNRAFLAIGLPSINWFGDPKFAKDGIIMLAQLGAGGTGIIFLAGLKAIPETFYEAAKIDGANAWKQFWHIPAAVAHPRVPWRSFRQDR